MKSNRTLLEAYDVFASGSPDSLSKAWGMADCIEDLEKQFAGPGSMEEYLAGASGVSQNQKKPRGVGVDMAQQTSEATAGATMPEAQQPAYEAPEQEVPQQPGMGEPEEAPQAPPTVEDEEQQFPIPPRHISEVGKEKRRS